VTAVEIFSMQLTSTLSDRSFEQFSKQMGKHGRVVSAIVVGAPDISQRRGEVLVQAFIAKTAPAGTRIVHRLCMGYFYNGQYLPGGHGSMPFDSTDYLFVIVANKLATNRLSIQLGITDDEGGPTSWIENVDTRTDGAPTRVTKASTAVGGSTGLVLAAVPTNASWRWISGQGTYTATATAGTRSVRFFFRDGSGNQYGRSTAGTPTLSQSMTYDFGRNMTSEGTTNLGGSNSIEFPSPDARLKAGHDLFIQDATNVDVLDTVTLEALVEELIEI